MPTAEDRARARAGAKFLRNLRAFEVAIYRLSPAGIEQLAALLDKIGARQVQDERKRSKVKVSTPEQVAAFAKANGMGFGRQSKAQLYRKRAALSNRSGVPKTK
jgi:hypothetical protein